MIVRNGHRWFAIRMGAQHQDRWYYGSAVCLRCRWWSTNKAANLPCCGVKR